MAVRTITTRLALDGEAQFKQGMASINASLREQKSGLALLEAQFKGQANSVEALTAKDKLLRQEVEQQTEKVKALQQALQDAAQVYGEDSNQVSNYQAQLNRAQTELIGMNQALDENSRYLEEAKNSADGTAKSIDQFGNSTKSAVDTLSAALKAAGVAAALNEIRQALMACVDSSIEFETAMASFNKVAKLSDADLSAMSESIKTMSTNLPATTTEIAQVAEAARRLGVEQDSLLSFTEVMINLGNVSDLTADQAATALARFANVVGTSADDYERLGSVIVALGNNFATSESEITEMASRLASAGSLAGLAEPEIMALAAAMSSVGIQAEAGGTAMTQTLTAMEKAVSSGGDKLDQFAKIAGMSAGEFAEAWGQDPITAITAFIGGLGQLDEQGESATQVLEELGMSGINQSNMLKSLALASETLTGTLQTANTAWDENTELAATAAERYSTTEAKMTMAANAANNLKIAIGDALTPALGDLASAGTAGFAWIAEVAEKHPEFVAGVTAMIGVVGLFSGGVAAYTVAANLAAAASGGLAVAMNMIPGVAVATTITGIVVALRTFISNAEDAKTANEELRESLEATKDALDASMENAEETAQSLRGMADAIVQLASSAELTGVQYQALQDLIQQLNAAIPGLNLAYDEQTGKLNMTADAVRNLIDAEGERLVNQEVAKTYNDLLTRQMVIAQQLTEAEVELAKAKAANAAASQEAIVNGERVIQLDKDLAAAQGEAARVVGELKQQYETLQEAIDELEAEYGELPSTLNETSNAFEETAQDFVQSMEELKASMEELEEATLYLAGANDTLSAALEEQSDQGRLSLQTTLDLIDAGYASAIAIDTETGAVTLNRDEYIRLATAKMQEQIAALEVQKNALISAGNLDSEAAAARRDSSAYWDLAASKLAENAASNDEIKSLDAQIAALKAAQSSLGSYTGAVTTAARSSASASKTVKTQAQQDLETYKQVKAELDHLKSVELVDEAEYYRKMAEYRDQYLTDDTNISEYRKVTEQIYKYDKSLAEQEAALWADQTDTLISELEQRVKSVTDQQDKMEDRLSGYGDLFKVTDNTITLENIQEQIDAIDAYEQALNSLRERNISGGLMDEVLAMDVDSATQYANQLLAMSEEQWQQYNDLWDEKQQRAAEVAEQFFKDQLDALENEYNDKLGAALDTLTDTSFDSGVDTAQGLIDGLASMEGALYDQAQAMADRVSSILAGAGRIPSNSELAASFSTERIAERYQGVTNAQLQSAVVGGVNAMTTANSGGTAQPMHITIQTEDKLTIARAFVPDIRTANKENPETLDDT